MVRRRMTFEEALAAIGGELPDVIQEESSGASASVTPVDGAEAETPDGSTVERVTEELMGASKVDDSGGNIPGMSTVEPVETGSDD